MSACRCCGREVEGDFGGCLCAALPKSEMAQRDLPMTEGSAMLRRLAQGYQHEADIQRGLGRAEAGTYQRSAEMLLREARQLEREAVENSRCSDYEYETPLGQALDGGGE